MRKLLLSCVFYALANVVLYALVPGLSLWKQIGGNERSSLSDFIWENL
jgi:hypothetical protein